MHKVEQSDYLLCEGLHEGIISEKDWYAAQEKRKLNNYKREKVLDPEHAHILSGILKCPCCEKSLYGNMSKAHSKDNNNRYYYYCKNTSGSTGHRCDFRRNIKQSEIDGEITNLNNQLTKALNVKNRLENQMDALDVGKLWL